jgi:hypothetical protein
MPDQSGLRDQMLKNSFAKGHAPDAAWVHKS